MHQKGRTSAALIRWSWLPANSVCGVNAPRPRYATLLTLLFFKTVCKAHQVVHRCLPLMRRSRLRRNNLRILRESSQYVIFGVSSASTHFFYSHGSASLSNYIVFCTNDVECNDYRQKIAPVVIMSLLCALISLYFSGLAISLWTRES